MHLPCAGNNNRGGFLAGVGAIVCVLLLALAIPRFIASLYALYPAAVFEQFKQSKQMLPGDVYEKSSAHLKKARAWFETGEYWQIQAFLQLLHLRSVHLLTPEKRQWLIRQARAAVMQGLSLSPVDPYAWFRLAVVEQMLGAKPQAQIEALRLSLYAGRVEPDLLMPRLSFAYRYYNHSDDEMRRLLQGQVRLAWLLHPKELVAFAAGQPEALFWVKDALFYSPDDWERFSRNLESYIQKNNTSKAKSD